MPGWGHWAGHNIEHAPERKRKKFALNIPEKLPRKDDSKFNVIMNEDMNAPLKEHRVIIIFTIIFCFSDFSL